MLSLFVEMPSPRPHFPSMSRRYTVKVKPRARRNQVAAAAEAGADFVVETTALPAEGAANEQVVRLLAKHLGVAPSRMRLVTGHRARVKIVEVDEDGGR